MANNITTTTASPAAYPNATAIATQQLADSSHASIAVLTDPTDRTKQQLITAAGESKVNIADGSNVTQGAKADAAWDGAAASPTIVAIWKYCAAKLEAIRAALTDATAVSLVKQVNNNGRVGVVIRVANVRVASAAETVLSLSVSLDGAAPSSVTSYSPAAGKRFRMLLLSGFFQNPSTNTTAANAIVRIRQNATGAAVLGSQEQEAFSLIGISAASGIATTNTLPISEGREIPDGAGICVTGIVPSWVLNTADPGIQITIVGYEYTP